MKIVHTADWHLGKNLNGKQLLEDQKYILTQFKQHMEKEQPDLIVIAGDLYDTSYPSKEAIGLLEETIEYLNIELKIPIIMISGNHDGRERLNYGSKWFENNQLYIRTQLENIDDPIELSGVQFFTLPFATVSEVQNYFKDKQIETYQQALNECLEQMSSSIDNNKVNILIGHLTIEGGKTSDSERPLTIGTVESVDMHSFRLFDYVMLGHLHHPFSINNSFIKYSGSILQYSFSEVNQSKGYRVLDIENNQLLNETFVPLKPLRELEVIEGDYEDIIQERIKVKNKNNYFHFKLTNVSHITDPMMKLKQIYPNILALSNVVFDHSENFSHVEIKKQDDQTIIENFYKNMTDQHLSQVQSDKIKHLLSFILDREG
ncbi:exonuclease SbcCD subunit D [Staphylococcus epidermidis]|uniref:exonuclease subunit SbcD n=1 Tax=Staphylococcus epidermidis TaxID=1282 RepID=UPI001F4EF51D|nr:exonuclease subunit SbcD [Staphylococcus epidermidis]UNH20677.1 exonuclease SbcCD subunit D [Staphylococcus epidermidis]